MQRPQASTLSDVEDVVARQRGAHPAQVARGGGQGDEAIHLRRHMHRPGHVRAVLREPPDQLAADATLQSAAKGSLAAPQRGALLAHELSSE